MTLFTKLKLIKIFTKKGKSQHKDMNSSDTLRKEADTPPYTTFEKNEVLSLISSLNVDPIPKLPIRKMSDTRPVLVLDLDETLIHGSLEKENDSSIEIFVPFNGELISVFIQKRPDLIKFLSKARKLFEIIIFTASLHCYAKEVIDLIDPKRSYIDHILCRDSCLNIGSYLFKELSVLQRDLTKVVIVDNCPENFIFNNENGVPISSWYNDKKDTELMKLLNFLYIFHEKVQKE